MAFALLALHRGQYGDERYLEKKDNLFRQISGICRFLRDFCRGLRYGELSRAPLRLLRFQLVGKIAECDWMARMPDPWDSDLRLPTRRKHQTLQAIRDAIDVRTYLFASLPQLESANIRVYRQSANQTPEKIIDGTIHRNDQCARNIHSIVMRAKVMGFRFCMEEDNLEPI